MDLPIRAIREQVASRRRPDRPPDPPQGRHAPDHPRHRGGADGGRRDHPPGRLHLRLLGGLRRRRPRPGRDCASTGLRPKFLEKLAHANVTSTRCCSPLDGAAMSIGSARRASPARSSPVAAGCAVGARLARSARRPTTTGSIDHVETEPATGLQVLVSRARRDADVDLDGGRRSRSTASTSTPPPRRRRPTATVQRTTVLAIDTSNSMAGGQVRGRQGGRPRLTSTPCPTTSTSAS